MDTTIRKINPMLYRKLKATAALRNMTVGAAVNDAIKLWLAVKNDGRKRI